MASRTTRKDKPAEARRTPAELTVHPDCSLVPEMPAGQYRAFRADIERRGIQTPLEITAGDEVVNGRHRLRAANELGLATVPVRVVAIRDPAAHVLGAALQQRWLTASQRAALALVLADWEQERERGKARRQLNLRQYADVEALPHRDGRSRDKIGKQTGVAGRLVQYAATVRDADPALFDQVIAGCIPVVQAAQQIQRAQRDAGLVQPALPDGLFQVIYADPAWKLGSPDSSRAPENHYPTLELDEIKALAPPAADASVLFLWAVNSRLREALEVVDAWGFEYRTNLAWVKQSIGLGAWTRNRHELLLFAVRGSVPAPAPADRPDSVIEALRGEHSEKPVDAYELIERAYPHASKLELFARGKPRPGWTAWGNQVAP
jgi:N6-adenosine-specific RNA methylase IME4